jgi:antitoxin MazE
MKTYSKTAKLAENKSRGQRAFVVAALLAARKPETLNELVERIDHAQYIKTFKGGLEGWTMKVYGKSIGGVPASVRYHLKALERLGMVKVNGGPAVARTQVVGWGNSQAIRIPREILDQVQIREGDEIEISVEGGNIALKPVNSRLSLESLVAGITPENQHGEQDWGRPVGHEIW